MEKYDCIIVGAGASGSSLAIMLARKNLKVLVIDKNNSPSKKLLITGNGKCNITNFNIKSEFYNQNIDIFFKKFNFFNAKDFFKSIGVHMYQDAQGRCYPISNSAKSVVLAIENQFKKLNINFAGEQLFTSYVKQNNQFIVNTNKNTYSCTYLVIACQKLDNFSNFSVNYSNYSKSLVALKTKENTKQLNGVRVQNVKASILKDNKTIISEFGEVLFKENGLSGICIFNLSAHFARQKSFNGTIILDLLPNISDDELLNILSENAKIYDKNLILTSILNEKLAKYLLSTISSNFNFEQLISLIHNLKFNVIDCYDNNQVFSGGVELYSLTENLENKNVKNMYFCGEVCNVDAICGGFNLQWAWTSAGVVSKNIIKKFS